MDVFIARQPIFDREQAVTAYELLYRNSELNAAVISDPERATTEVFLNSFVELGLERVLGGQRAFINTTRPLLLGRYPLPRSENPLTLEVLEDVAPDPDVIEAVRGLRQEGYQIALDDFIFYERLAPLVELADVIKIDIRQLGPEAVREHVARLRAYDGLTLLAEKVETPEEFEACRELGFDLFQGYFFCEPAILKGRGASPSRLATMELLAQLNNPDFAFEELAKVIERDVGLSYKLLRFINSAYFNLPRRIESVIHALMMLGERNIRTWMNLVALSRIDDKPHELLIGSLVRAKMGQQIAEATGREGIPDRCFLAGLLSAVDAFVDLPMAEVMASLSLAEDIEQGILHRAGPVGEVLELVLRWERGEWEQTDTLGLGPTRVAEIYVESVDWAGTASRAMTGPE